MANKTAKEWLDDVRLACEFESMVHGYDIYGGELEELAGGFWWSQLDNMNMAGLEDNEYMALEAYVTTGSKTKAAAKMGYSLVWYGTLLSRAIGKVDNMLSVTDKYSNFRD